MEVENKLKAMGLELPAARTPPPGRAGAVKIGNLLFVGGHTPGPAYVGKLGAGFTVEQGYDGARQACLNCLADVKAAIGDLDKVKRVAKLLCMVNSTPDFGQQPPGGERRHRPAEPALRRCWRPCQVRGGLGSAAQRCLH
jgi:enamine deaminase RidA (YjgF/YER057c/UK114 family)